MPAFIQIKSAPLTIAERRREVGKQHGIWLDRAEYQGGEIEVIGCAIFGAEAIASVSLSLEMLGDRPTAITLREVECDRERLTFQLSIADLPEGSYRVVARPKGKAGNDLPQIATTFVKTAAARATSSAAFSFDLAHGIPLHLQPQTALRDVDYPTHAAVPLPFGFLKLDDLQTLALMADGRELAPQEAAFEAVDFWDSGSLVRWLHVHFIGKYRAGKALQYLLRTRVTDTKSSTGLNISETPGAIAVSSHGGASLNVRKKAFAGLLDRGGPYLVDGRGVRFESRFDESAVVTLERAGPTYCVIRAEGSYQSEKKNVAPIARFVVRLKVYAGSGLVKLQWSTTFTDPRQKIAQIGFLVPVQGATSLVSGIDGKHIRGVKNLRITQSSHDRCRHSVDAGKELTATRGDGYVSARLPDRKVSLLVKDFWQRFPRELEADAAGLTLRVWPKHLGKTFGPSGLKPAVLHKFLCFLEGPLLDLTLPEAYFKALKSNHDSTECKPEYAKAGSAAGITMHAEFAVLLGDLRADERGWTQLVEQDPIAMPSPQAIADSGVLGPTAAVGTDFPQMEEALELAFEGYCRGTQRYGDYGWCNYGDYHHFDLAEKPWRPSLHRNWLNDHYGISLSGWLLFARAGNPPLLRLARRITNHHGSIDMIRYDAAASETGRPSIQGHSPGSFAHCKGISHWGGRDYGMDQDDDDWGIVGHWVQPDGLLWAWLIDADHWALDGYRLWQDGTRQFTAFPIGGVGREINQSLGRAITLFQFTHDATLLPCIWGMAASLRSRPLATQTGGLWDPTAPSRFFEMTRDPQHGKWIIEQSHSVGTQQEAIYSLALSATAFAISGDRSHLDKFGNWCQEFPWGIHRDANHQWDGYGFAPGPLGDGHAPLQWGRFLKAAQLMESTNDER